MRVSAQPASKPQQRPLKVGSSGPRVLKLEQELKERGLLNGAVDANFNRATKQAVKKFERSMGWKADGIVGKRVWKKLELAGEAHEGTTADITKGKTKFTTVNINVKSNPPMRQDQVVHDVKRAAAAGDIIGWNEISVVGGPNGDRYFDAIKGLGKAWEHYMPKHNGYRIPNPISWKKDEWDKVDDGFRRMHKNGASAGHTNVSPARYVTWVKLQNKKTGETIIRMNTHLISGAWNSKNNKAKEWRKDMWHKHMRQMREMVARFERKGTPVIIGGDFNRDSYKLFGNQVKYDNNIHVGTHGASTLDYVMHTPHKDLKRVGGRIQKGYASDHDAVAVNYQLG
ncbi:MAG: peptidoglycan-binding protein [Archangium sp.]